MPISSSESIFPQELYDEFITYLFNVPVGGYDETLLQTFNNVSLVNKTFLQSARRHSHLLKTKHFITAKQIQSYIEFVNVYPESTIPGLITAVTIKLDMDDDDHENMIEIEIAAQAFLVWRSLFPNITNLRVFMTQLYWEPFSEIHKLGIAMQEVLTSPKLHSLTLYKVCLPANYFNKTGQAIKSFQFGTLRGSWPRTMPRQLERLLMLTYFDVVDAINVKEKNPGIYDKVKELSIQGQAIGHTSYDWGGIWKFLSSFKNSLKSLILNPHFSSGEEMNDPLDLLELENLEVLTVYTSPTGGITEYINWLSWIFRSMHNLDLTTFRLLIADKFLHEDDLGMWDTWIAEFFPPKMKLEIVVQTEIDDTRWQWSTVINLDHRRLMPNCNKRGILRVIDVPYDDIDTGYAEVFKPYCL